MSSEVVESETSSRVTVRPMRYAIHDFQYARTDGSRAKVILDQHGTAPGLRPTEFLGRKDVVAIFSVHGLFPPCGERG